MICLDNTDTLEGGASVNNVVDYTVHGLVGTAFTNIAQGQLSDTNPSVLYTAGAAISIVSVIFVNTHSAAVTVDLYLDPANAGTPRRLIPKTLTLGIGYSMHFDGQRLTILDASGRIATSLPQDLGTNASPTFIGETLSGLTASLPVFTGANKELVSKSVADTLTALQLPVGMEIMWPTETAPTGWLEEDGASLERTGTYANLFGIIGTMYGTADETHFNLPDMRGRFPRIWAHGSTNDPDRATRTVPGATGATLTSGDHVGTEQTDAFQGHGHVIAYDGANLGTGYSARTGTVNTTPTANGVVLTPSTLGAYGDPRLSAETRSINSYRMMIIKY